MLTSGWMNQVAGAETKKQVWVWKDPILPFYIWRNGLNSCVNSGAQSSVKVGGLSFIELVLGPGGA